MSVPRTDRCPGSYRTATDVHEVRVPPPVGAFLHIVGTYVRRGRCPVCLGEFDLFQNGTTRLHVDRRLRKPTSHSRGGSFT